MGCLLGCFNSSKDRKRRKQRYKVIPRDQDPKSQNLVQADLSLVQIIKDTPSISLPESRGKNEEPLNSITKKKVTFDTNVTTYEHVQIYDSTESLLEKNENGETHSHSDSDSGLQNGSNIASGGSYPPNYRYGNCLESDDEIEDYYDDENVDDLDEDYEDGIVFQEAWSDSIPSPIPSTESRTESRNPVENLSQWKSLKSKVTPPPKPSNFNRQNEKYSQNQETAVDASLSNWLCSSEKNTPNNKRVGCYNYEDSTTTSITSIEDRPILGALTVVDLKQFSPSCCTPRKSPSRSPDDMPIIGSVGRYWSHTNTTSKYKEDKNVNWQNVNVPFETRLESTNFGY